MRDTTMTETMTEDLAYQSEFGDSARETLLADLRDCSVALSGEESRSQDVAWFAGRTVEPARAVPPFIAMRSVYPGDDAPEGTPGTGDAICRPCRGTGESEIGGCYNCGGTGIVIQAIGG